VAKEPRTEVTSVPAGKPIVSHHTNKSKEDTSLWLFGKKRGGDLYDWKEVYGECLKEGRTIVSARGARQMHR